MPRKAKSVSADDILKQMYPDLGTSDDFFPAEDDKPEPKDDVNKTIADLQAKIAGLEGTLSGYQRGKVTEAPIQRGQAPQPPAPIILPDPNLDPEGYKDAVLLSVQQKIDHEKAIWQYQQQNVNSAAQRSQGLWQAFTEKYENYAADEERVEVATQRVIQRAHARGLDTEKLMYENQDAFMQSVVGEYNKLFGEPADEDGEDDTDVDDDVQDNRSQIMGAGAPSARSGPANVQKPQNPFGELSQELMVWQGKTGYAR